MMKDLLANIVWHTLAGPHARFTVGTDEARRYAPGFPPFVGFADLRHPNFDSLAPYVAPGERLYCDGWSGAAPAGWSIASETVMSKMRWEASMPVAADTADAIRLEAEHAAAALELATLAAPGPFTLRTIELGEYFGVFDGPRLVAMAGGRSCAGGYAEISGVCTHPDFQGKGLARRLVVHLIRRQMQRGETPFLRVLRDNDAARGLYQRMGFRQYRETAARVILRA